MPARPCPLPYTDAHRPPADSRREASETRQNSREPRRRTVGTRSTHEAPQPHDPTIGNPDSRTPASPIRQPIPIRQRCVAIAATVIFSITALTACTPAEAEPPTTITQTAKTPEPTAPTPTPTPHGTKPTVTITEMPEAPDTQAALMAYAKFEHAMQKMAITGASDESVDSALNLVAPGSDAEGVVNQMAPQYSEMGPREITGTLSLNYYDVMDRWDNTVQLSLCLDVTAMTAESGPTLPSYLKSTPAMTKTNSGWVVTYYRTHELDQCP